ncbi:hypothetical protein LDENG_00258220 [Lucifuga dentata]|nr:hypothetical protein LDENG_00258220 [Lucifuga dentata]
MAGQSPGDQVAQIAGQSLGEQVTLMADLSSGEQVAVMAGQNSGQVKSLNTGFQDLPTSQVEDLSTRVQEQRPAQTGEGTQGNSPHKQKQIHLAGQMAKVDNLSMQGLQQRSKVRVW